MIRPRGQKGFTLVELIIVMALTTFVMIAATKILGALMFQFKQQGKIAETSAESVVGLEVLRRDIQAAGHGLATGLKTGINKYDCRNWSDLDGYKEAAGTDKYEDKFSLDPSKFNDPKAPPRPFISSSALVAVHQASDYLVMKSVNYGDSPAAGKYHVQSTDGTLGADFKNTWYPLLGDPQFDWNLLKTDRVIVLAVWDNEDIGLVLKGDVESCGVGGTPVQYSTKYELTWPYKSEDRNEKRVIYGIIDDPDDKGIRAPFNRVDYYISTKKGTVPQNCAPNTGVLVRRIMTHRDETYGGVTYAAGELGPPWPILDCVADLQVIYGLDTLDKNGDPGQDGVIDSYSNDAGATAEEVWNEVRQVRVYILAHEGQFDRNFKFVPDPANAASTSVYVGEFGYGRDFNLATRIGGNWQYFRWRIYSFVESPSLLR